MFSSMVSKVWNELEFIGFNMEGELCLVKMANNIWTFRLEENGTSYVIKYYEDKNVNEMVKMWEELENVGVVGASVVGSSDKIIVFKEFDYRLATIEDFKDEGFISRLADFYRRIHSVSNLGLSEYNDYFSLNNIRAVINKFNLGSNLGMIYIYNNFENIKLKLDRVKKCVLYGTFSLEDICVCSDGRVAALSIDYLKYGYRSADLIMAMENIEERQRKIFLKSYGEVREDELIVGKVVGCMITLYLATKERSFPLWAGKSVEMINNGSLLRLAKNLVEWY